jgi:integrase
VHESTKTQSKTVAREAEKQRRRRLEESWNQITRRTLPPTFQKASEDWLTVKTVTLSPRSVAIEEANLRHVRPVLGSQLVNEITPADIAKYQQARIAEGASRKTVNLEVATVRMILRRVRLWANLQMEVKMLPAREDVGQAISHEQEKRLLEECSKSRSRSLNPAVTLALSTAMRYSEIRLLKWKQLDFSGKQDWVGKSKTEYGEGRPIPINDRAFLVMSMWAETFPDRKPEHYVFPTEKCGAAGDEFKPCIYATDPTVPIGDWKEAWEAAKKRSGVSCRFHDLRQHADFRIMPNLAKPFFCSPPLVLHCAIC